MSNKVIGIITKSENDILQILENNSIKLKIFEPDSIYMDELESCYSIAILAGTESEPLLFNPIERTIIEKQIIKGKKIFSEFCNSIGNVYSQTPSDTRLERLCFCHDKIVIDGIAYGDILDDQANSKIKPWEIACSSKTPLMQYVRVNVHSKTHFPGEMLKQADERALWYDEPENLLICAFKISNFIKARFTPVNKWKSLIKYILEWLCEERIDLECINSTYSLTKFNSEMLFKEQVRKSINIGMSWFEKSKILINDGNRGLHEGIAAEIYPDGNQRILTNIRIDCMGEVSFSYFLKYLLDNNIRNLEIANNLSTYIFKYMQVKKDGPCKGMMRWSNQAWGVCYQDDVARCVIPELLKCLYTGKKLHLDECTEALKFLLRTTGTDGMRIMRTENKNLNDDMLKLLSSKSGNYPSAHYNAYYMASLLLAYKLTGINEFKETGIKGLETIMSVYPETIREHSETQELCRLILPLAYLYWVTKQENHKNWLYRITEDLKKFRHYSGGYLEWDTGYKSARFGKSNDECSLLTKNGDPVVDLLYSLNWLPMAFIQAYLITEDKYFKELWKDISKFMVSIQLHSDNSQINGGWARAMDVELMEVFANPNDLGWGPWVIESGWTVAEILSGLLTGLLCDNLEKFYKN